MLSQKLSHDHYMYLNLESTIAGNVKVFCRARPLFENEGSNVVEFPDDCTIRINTGDDNLSNPKKDFEFDRVYGPHVGQGATPIFDPLSW